MSADTDGPDADEPDEELVPLDVTVPKRLRDELDELATDQEYADRSAYVRAVLEHVTEPILTPAAEAGIEEGYSDVAAGRTVSPAEARERLGLPRDEEDTATDGGP